MKLFSIYTISSLLFFSSCTSSSSWTTMYGKQKQLFQENQATFNHALRIIDSSKFSGDTIIIASSFIAFFGKSISDSLIALDILNIKFNAPWVSPERDYSCRDVIFNLGKKWHKDNFYILDIQNTPCDMRSKKEYHWMRKDSEHKHSFGFGNGWFLYTDSDFL